MIHGTLFLSECTPWKPQSAQGRRPQPCSIRTSCGRRSARRSSSSIRARMIKNPVMFVVEVVAALTTVIFIRDLVDRRRHICCFTFQIIVWLWFTVLFANFAEAVAEGRGKAQADSLRQARAPRPWPSATRRRPAGLPSRFRRTELEARRHRAGRSRRHHPVRRRGDRGHRLGQRGRPSPASRRP